MMTRRWTPLEENRLRLFWGARSVPDIAETLGRSAFAVYQRAELLGLGLGCPRGYEYLTAAARRTGFEVARLRLILGEAGFKIRGAMVRGGATVRYYVDPEKVDAAVASWLATETLAGAARRLGMWPDTLERRLLASGVPLPPKPPGKRHWRIPSEAIEQALSGKLAA